MMSFKFADIQRGKLAPVVRLISRGFCLATTFRNALYDRRILPVHPSSLPVISVGNLSVGGSGKTPLVRAVCSILKEGGQSPVVLIRGYKGKEPGPYKVNPKEDTAEKVGDEALMLSQDFTVVVARDRFAGARYIERESLGSVIILDDGFQHRRLVRDLNILCIDASTKDAVDDLVLNRVLPYGRLRESFSDGISRADIVVLSFREQSADAERYKTIKSALPKGIKTYVSTYKVKAIKSLAGGAPLEGKQCKGMQCVAMCGIANPEGFKSTLMRHGLELKGWFAYPDHYAFQEKEIKGIAQRYPDIPIVCTEKDGVKLRHLSASLLSKIYVVHISAEIDPFPEFQSAINATLRHQG
ncbi:MAG: tetraacyldisaccharide 4'-kinase [Candidatus Dadabacteria bacterium]|nr:MAG: tetraacyldisaccharide 4'-kinase [Candidatus Dadabacteria bacterium]